MKTLARVAAMVLTANTVKAGDGTQTSPYTIAELLAQKDALAASGNTVWVKADLKGLGEDGQKTDNADGEGSAKNMARAVRESVRNEPEERNRQGNE